MENHIPENLQILGENMEAMRDYLMEEDDGTHKKIIGGHIIRIYESTNENKGKHIIRDKKYYRELTKEILQEQTDRIKENFRKFREE